MAHVTIQPAAYTDNLWATSDGALVEGAKLPYPFHVNADGTVERQDFWRGEVAVIIGFTAVLDRRAIDLRWEEAWEEPQRAVGMYAVTADSSGNWSTWQTAVESAVKFQ